MFYYQRVNVLSLLSFLGGPVSLWPRIGSLSHPPGLDVTLEAMVHQFFLHIMAINMDNLI